MDALLSDIWPYSWTLLHLFGLCAAWSTRLHLNDRGWHFAHACFVGTFLAIAACAVVSYANVDCSCMLSGTTMGAMVIWAVWESHVEQRQHGHY